MSQREIVGVINDETLHSIGSQQFKEQIFPFTPVSSRLEPQSAPQMVSQCSFARVVFGRGHCKYRIPLSCDHPCLTTGLIPKIAYSHRLAASWLCHNDMPTPLSPGLS